MADRFPLILNTSTNQIQEIPSGDSLDLTGSGITNAGIITAGNVTIGAATTDLIVNGDARITGILTIGTSSLKLDGPNNLVNVGTALTLGHTQGLQFHTQNLHSAGFEVNQINVSGASTMGNDVTFNGASSKNMVWDSSDGALDFVDNANIKMGNNNDLSFSHDGTSSRIQDFYGALFIGSNLIELKTANLGEIYLSCVANGAVSLRYDNNTKLATTSSGVTVTGDGTFTGNVSVGGTLTYEDVTNIDSVGIVTARDGVFLPDLKQLKIGNTAAAPDLYLWHNSSTGNSNISNKTGDLFIQGNNGSGTVVNQIAVKSNAAVELNYQGTKKFETSSTGATITGALTASTLIATSSVTSNNNILLNSDSGKLSIGTGSDLQLFHNGSHSYIQDNGTGALYIGSNGGGIYIRGQHGEESIIANSNGSVELYHDNTKRFETTSTGVKTLGDVSLRNSSNTQTIIYDESDGQIEFLDNIKASFGTGGDLLIHHNGSVNVIDAATSAAISFRYGGSEQFFIGDAEFKGGDNKKIKLGAGDDLQCYHDASDSHIANTTGIFFIQNTGDLRIRVDNTDAAIHCVRNGAVELYHSGNKKLETTSAGVQVTGALNVTTTMHIPDGSIGLQIGSSNDLRIYHDGNNSAINDTGTGSLYIQGSNNIYLRDYDTAENHIVMTKDGSVDLYHNGTKRFATLSTGCQVANIGNNGGLLLSGTGNNTGIQFTSTGSSPNNGYRLSYHSAASSRYGDEYVGFEVTDNSGNYSDHICGFTNDGLHFPDNKIIHLGGTAANGDLKIYHDGSHTRIAHGGTGQLIISGNDNDQVKLMKGTGEEGIILNNNAAVLLHYNNVQCAETIETNSVKGWHVGDSQYINTAVTHGELIVRKNLASPNNAAITQCARMTIMTNEQTGGGNGYGGAVFFGGQDVSAGNQYCTDYAAIGSTMDNVDLANATPSAQLNFWTRNGGTFSEKMRIYANGTLEATDTSIGSLSDKRLKKNIKTFEYDLENFKALKPKTFNWIKPEYHTDTPLSGAHRGFIAQDIEKVDPELISEGTLSADSKERELVGEDAIAKTAILGRKDAMYVSVIQQLIDKIEKLETEVAALKPS